MSCSCALRRSPKPGALTATDLKMPRILFTTRRRERLAVDVLGDDEQLLAALDHLVDDGQQVLDGRDLGVDDQDVRVLEHRLLAVGVRDEVLRQVALVEAHALGQLELGAEGVRLLDGDDALLADLVDGLGDEGADLGVGGGDGRGGRDLLLGLDLLRVLEGGGDGRDGLLDAALQARSGRRRPRRCAGPRGRAPERGRSRWWCRRRRRRRSSWRPP